MTDKPDATWWKYQKLSRQDGVGCLCGLIGSVAGFIIGGLAHAAEVAKLRAANPDMTIDFLPGLVLAGVILGGSLEAVCGVVPSRLLPPHK